MATAPGILLALLLSALQLSSLSAVPTVANDLFDTSRGTRVTADSGMRGGFHRAAIFGGDGSIETGQSVFADDRPPGFIHFVEWETTTPISLNRIHLFASGDEAIYNYQREFASFTLKAKRHAGDTFTTVHTFTPSHPYTFLDNQSLAIIAADVGPVEAQYFRAEFVQHSSGGFFDGPRIIELDGFGSTLQPQIPQSTNDLWDVSQGATISASSGVWSGFHESDAIGTSFSLEPGQLVFADGRTNGSTHFIEWKTRTPILLTNFNIFAAGDGAIYNHEREFAQFILKAKVNESEPFQTIYSYSAQHPYQEIDPVSHAIISATIAPIEGQYFRAEFVQWNAGRGYDGPRVIEMDGYGTIVYPTITTSTNDLWDTAQGATVTATSGVRSGFFSSDAFGTFRSAEPGSVIFSDGKPAGYNHYLEWQSATPIRLVGFNLFAAGDAPIHLYEREFEHFTLKAKRHLTDEFSTLYTFTPTHPYTYLDTKSAAILSVNIPQTDAQFFRAEFVQRNVGRGFDAPRVVELDAVATILPQGQGTIADWNFEEGNLGQFATNILDHSGNGHHASPIGSPRYVGGSGSDTGEIALEITGGSYFRPSSSESFNFRTNDFTVEAVFQPGNRVSTNQTIIAGQNPSDGGVAYLLSYSADPGVAKFSLITSNGFVQYVSVPFPNDAAPHHIAASRRGGTIAIYLDHQLAQSKDASVSPNFPITGAVDLRIGAASFGGWFEGSIDRVRISNGALTVSEFIPFTPSALRIVQQPQSQSAMVGRDVSFFITVDSAAPASFQWFFDGSALPGATNPVLNLVNIQLAAAGFYNVEVMANGKSVTSQSAQLSVSTLPLNAPVRNDLFDVSRGTRVTRHSGVFRSISPGAMFGDASPSVEPGTTIFGDGRTNGFTHFIEWRTASPVVLRSFKLFAAGDPPIYLHEREFSSFTLLAKSSPVSTNFDRVIFSYSATHPYTYVDAGSALLIDALLNDPVLAQEFRAEFVQWNAGRGYDGPRIIELDGFGDAISLPPPTIADWDFESGSPGQQVQFVPDVSGNSHHISHIIGSSNVFVATEQSTAGAISLKLPGGLGTFGNALRAPDSLDFNLGNEFTIEVSVTPGIDNDGTRAILAGQSAYTSHLLYALDYRGEQRTLGFLVADPDGQTQLVSARIPDDGIPHHVAGVYSEGVVKIYLDKVLVMSKAANLLTSLPNAGAARVTLGAVDTGAYAFQGILDRVRLSRAALSPNEFFEHRRDADAPLTIVQPIQNISIDQGGTATFHVAATGPAALSYSWSHNDSVISHQTNSSLSLQNVQFTNAGIYKVTVRSGPWEASSSATLTVNEPTNSAPTILVQPVSRRVPTGAYASFSVVAAGSPPLTYQWNRNGSPLQDETLPSLVFSNVSYLHSGEYSVEVRNSFGSTSSVPAMLTILAPDTNGPIISIHSPMAGATLSNRITLAGMISDNEGVTHADWFRNDQLVGPLLLTNGQFSLSNILLSTGTNTFTIRAYDEAENVGTASVVVVLEVQRSLAVGSPSPVQEGARVIIPIMVSSSGEIGALSFTLGYDSNYLSEPNLRWENPLDGAFAQVNTGVPGSILGTYVLPGRTLGAGAGATLATVSFRTRSIPQTLTTPIILVLNGIYSDAGDPITSGTAAHSGEVQITRRDFIGDNNANDRLDIADATAIIRMVTLLDPIRPWDVTGNDLNNNSTLDAGDIVRVLRAVVNLDPQPSGENVLLAQRIATASSLNGRVALSSSSMRLTPGGQVKVLVSLADLGQPISGAAFRLNYPASALRLESSASHGAGTLVPQNSVVMWNLLPDQNYSQQSGTIHFAASSATAWAANSGAIAELNFTVLPAAASQYAWPIRLSQGEAASGLDPVSLGSAEILLTGRDAQPAELTEVSFDSEAGAIQLRLVGEAGIRYRVMSSPNLADWTEVGVYSDAAGAVLVSDPIDPDAAHKFYRATQVD